MLFRGGKIDFNQTPCNGIHCSKEIKTGSRLQRSLYVFVQVVNLKYTGTGAYISTLANILITI